MLKKAADNNANLLLNFGLESDGSIPEDINREFRALDERIRKDGYPKPGDMEGKTHGRIDNNETIKTAR